MKRVIIGLITATALTSAIPAIASAQSINERQDNLFDRIDAGVRARQLTQTEANSLRTDFNALARLENDYRRSGGRLTDAERTDLDRRFDVLSARIRFDRSDDDRRGPDRGPDRFDDRRGDWQPINQRQDALYARIEQGVRGGGLNRVEADRLRTEFQSIVRLEDQYRRGGLSSSERADLDRRLDTLSREIRMERRDGQQAGQAGQADIGERLSSLSIAIDRAARSGRISEREARSLRERHREISSLDARYRNGGYSRAERSELDGRLTGLEGRLSDNAGRAVGSIGGGGYRR